MPVPVFVLGVDAVSSVAVASLSAALWLRAGWVAPWWPAEDLVAPVVEASVPEAGRVGAASLDTDDADGVALATHGVVITITPTPRDAASAPTRPM